MKSEQKRFPFQDYRYQCNDSLPSLPPPPLSLFGKQMLPPRGRRQWYLRRFLSAVYLQKAMMAIKFKQQLRCKHRKVIPKVSLLWPSTGLIFLLPAFLRFNGILCRPSICCGTLRRSKNDTSISFKMNKSWPTGSRQYFFFIVVFMAGNGETHSTWAWGAKEISESPLA